MSTGPRQDRGSYVWKQSVNKVYKSGKCCTKENKEAVVFALSVNKLGFWTEATEHQKVFLKSQVLKKFGGFLSS